MTAGCRCRGEGAPSRPPAVDPLGAVVGRGGARLCAEQSRLQPRGRDELSTPLAAEVARRTPGCWTGRPCGRAACGRHRPRPATGRPRRCRRLSRQQRRGARTRPGRPLADGGGAGHELRGPHQPREPRHLDRCGLGPARGAPPGAGRRLPGIQRQQLGPGARAGPARAGHGHDRLALDAAQVQLDTYDLHAPARGQWQQPKRGVPDRHQRHAGGLLADTAAPPWSSVPRP